MLKSNNDLYVAKIIRFQGMKMVNICDEALISKTIKDGKIEVNVSESYFGGERIDKWGAIELVKSSPVINLVGSRIVKEVIKENLASKDAVKKVGSTCFLMIFKF
jgi:hypothetical protein